MNYISKLLLLAFVIIFIQGCSSSPTMKSGEGVSLVPDEKYASIVFMRSSFVMKAIDVQLFEINNGELEFVGTLYDGTKISHRTTPGVKVYMAYGSAADFMIANVEENKTYFSIVRPNFATGGFAPTPIRSDGTSAYNMEAKEFEEWKENTELLVKKPEARRWFIENKEKYIQIYNKFWERFQTKTESQKSERTLRTSDGI